MSNRLRRLGDGDFTASDDEDDDFSDLMPGSTTTTSSKTTGVGDGVNSTVDVSGGDGECEGEDSVSSSFKSFFSF